MAKKYNHIIHAEDNDPANEQNQVQRGSLVPNAPKLPEFVEAKVGQADDGLAEKQKNLRKSKAEVGTSSGN